MSRCCNACKTPFFCGHKSCWCHAFQLDDNSLAGRSTYPDPTGDKAVRNLTRREPKRKRNQR